ncbi:coiled-coil domain-containing protein 144A-like isoform X4 [Vicugna pacos]|uniref:Coiled-coil domain-containing protein 144A-like isoform X4 n=1 Tax=Vicugna pacos TaxID=30538 RepID=A0ABM5EAB3_VICPA
MKKRLAKFASWVDFSIHQRERGNHEKPVPGYHVHRSELKEFHKAAYLGDTRTVQELLSHKKNVDSRDRRNRTALHLACASGQSSVVALLTQWKCDLDARDEESRTALIKAVQCRKEECVTILLKQGADPNLEDNFQNTALHYAVLAENTSIAAELLRYNANIEAINQYNFTPFLVAVRENREEMVKFLIDNGANVHAVDMLQRSALMLAVFHDSPDMVKLLLQKHVNASSLDFQGWSAERYACRNGFNHLYQQIVDYRDEKIPNTPPQNSDLGQSSGTKESLPSSHTGAESIQEKLQLSGKDDEEEMVVELGTSNGSRMDSLKNVEQKTDLVVEVSPSNEDISVIRVSPKHDIDDSRPPSDDDLDLAPKSTSEIQLPSHVDHLSGATGLGEKNTSSGQIENSAEKYPHLKPAVGVKDSVPKKTGAMKNLQRLKSAYLDLEWTSEEEQETLVGSENNHSQDTCVLRACTVKEKKSEDQIKQTNLSLVYLQKTPREPEVNKEHDRKDVPVSSKHSCVEKHEDMWVKQAKLDWKNNSECITRKSDQKISKIHDKGKITFHRKVESLHDNSELHGDLKELPPSVTDYIFDCEEKDVPGASVSVGSQAFSEHKEPSLKNVFPSYSMSESKEYGCQSSSKLYLSENKLDEHDKADTERVFNKNEESFYNRENEVRNRVPFTVNEDQELNTKRIQKRNQNTDWKSDIGRASQVEVEENRSKSGELRGSETMCDGSYHEGLTQQRKRGKTDDQQSPALQKGDSDRSCPGLHMKEIKKNESGKRTLKASVTSRVFAKTASLAGGLLHMNDNSNLSEDQGCGRSSKKTSIEKDQVKEQMNSVDGLDDLTLAPETASEDCESLFPDYKNTLRLNERLGPESKDPDRLLEIQDPVDSFRSIELKESDCAVLRGKLKEMENKVNWLHTELLKTREAKSQLKLQNVEWKRELCRMRCTLEQETKKKNAYTLYEKSKDDLKRKEKQYNEQVYLKQQLESTARALECKLKSVRNKPNQVLEERNDAQRQLSREQNAQVIQDEILAHRLSQQKEAEKANKKKNAEDTMDFELSDPKDSSEVLPQQLPEAEHQFRGPEIELHLRRDALRPTMLVLECVHRDRGQAQRSNKETEPLSQSKQGDVIKYIAKQAFLKETVCKLQSENTLLRQQLEVARNEARSEKTMLNTPEPFPDHMGKLEAMSRRVLMLEEGNKELIKECRCLKDRLCQYEMDRAEMEARMRQLQQELADTRKKVSMLEASMKVTAHHQTNSQNKRQDGERKPHQTANPNADLPAKEESTSSVLLHLSAETQLLLKEMLSVKEMQKKCEALEEEKKKLEEEALNLRHHLEVNTVGHSQVEQDKRETEEQTRRDVVKTLKKFRRAVQYRRETEKKGRHDVVEKLKEISQFLQAQAALQENVLRECKRASASQTEQRVKDLEPELKSDSNENRLEKYKQLYLEELENRKSLASQLTSANERLAEVSSKLQLERQHKSSFPGFAPTRPVGGPLSAAGTSAEAKTSLTRRRCFRTVPDPSTN